MRSKKLLLLTLMLMMTLPLATLAQIPVQNWWTSNEANTETGKLQEVRQKRKVFLSVAFSSSEADASIQQEQALIRKLVTSAISAYKGLELVGTADQAELAISIVASQTNSGQGAGNFSANLNADLQTPLEVTVLVRGAMQRNGTYRPRVVWSMASQNVHGEPGPAAVFAVDGFIDQLKKARGEKN